MTTDELLFFNRMPDALPLYQRIAENMREAFPNVEIRVQKTQITFRERYGFAFISLRRMKGCPETFLILSFGLGYRLDSPRIAAAVEPYPNRWTHHMVISSPEQIDGQVMEWLRQAHDFALCK
jgi:hypothetical protein